MKTKILIPLAIFLVAAGGYTFMSSNTSDVEQNTIVQEENENITGNEAVSEEKDSMESDEVLGEDGSFEGSIFELAKSGKGYRCEVRQELQGMSSDGVVYVAGDNIRGDYTSEVPVVGVITTSMIADGEKVYTWNSMSADGYVSSQNSEVEGDTEAPMSDTEELSFNHTYSYNCAPWSPNDSMFALPEEITFSEIGVN
jgi:hypothetical protein